MMYVPKCSLQDRTERTVHTHVHMPRTHNTQPGPNPNPDPNPHQVGIQIEEPFSILPLEAFCNSAIAACNEEILGAVDSGVFEHDEYEQLQ